MRNRSHISHENDPQILSIWTNQFVLPVPMNAMSRQVQCRISFDLVKIHAMADYAEAAMSLYDEPSLLVADQVHGSCCGLDIERIHFFPCSLPYLIPSGSNRFLLTNIEYFSNLIIFFTMANGTATNPAAAASASAAAAAKKLKAAAKLLRYSNNEDVTKYFSAGICGIILLFTILHWTRFFYKRARSKQSSKILGLPIAFTR